MRTIPLTAFGRKKASQRKNVARLKQIQVSKQTLAAAS